MGDACIGKSDTVAIDDNLRISLVTCYPGDKIYELFGHTAIRVQRSGSEAFDLAFNYGMFSFATGNFVYKFTAGQTDYMLGAYDLTILWSTMLCGGLKSWNKN